MQESKADMTGQKSRIERAVLGMNGRHPVFPVGREAWAREGFQRQ